MDWRDPMYLLRPLGAGPVIDPLGWEGYDENFTISPQAWTMVGLYNTRGSRDWKHGSRRDPRLSC